PERLYPSIENPIALGERFAGVQRVVSALVAWESGSASNGRTYTFIARPTLCSPRARVPGRVAPVVRYVVAVLVRRELLDGRPVWWGVPRQDDRLEIRDVARVGIGPAN